MSINVSSTPGYSMDYLANKGESPRVVPVNLLFGTVAPQQPSWLFDYSNNQQQSYLKTLQGLWIDNLDNSATVEIDVQGNSTQRLVAPANSQGYYPILVSGSIKLLLASSGTAKVPVYFLNQPVNPYIWFPNGSGGGSSSVTIAGPNPLPVSFTQPVSVTQNITSQTQAIAARISLTTSAQNLNTIAVAANASWAQNPNGGFTIQCSNTSTGSGFLIVEDSAGNPVAELFPGQSVSFGQNNIAPNSNLYQVLGSAAGIVMNVSEVIA